LELIKKKEMEEQTKLEAEEKLKQNQLKQNESNKINEQTQEDPSNGGVSKTGGTAANHQASLANQGTVLDKPTTSPNEPKDTAASKAQDTTSTHKQDASQLPADKPASKLQVPATAMQPASKPKDGAD